MQLRCVLVIANAKLARSSLVSGSPLSEGFPNVSHDLIYETAGRPNQAFRSRNRNLHVRRHPQQHLLTAERSECDLAMVGDIDEGVDRVTSYSERRRRGDIGEGKGMPVEGSATTEIRNVGKLAVCASGTKTSFSSTSWLPLPRKPVLYQVSRTRACDVGNQQIRVSGKPSERTLGLLSLSMMWMLKARTVECWQPLLNGQRPLTR